MKCFILALLLLPVFSFAQNTNYTPPKPGYKIDGKEVLYNGYVISRTGTKAYNDKREYAGFCFGFKSMLPVVSETDSLVMVANSSSYSEDDYTFFYFSKNSIGTETAIPLDNFDLNERYVDREWWRNENFASAEDCGESNETPAEEEGFTTDDYPDVVVELITEKDFFNAELKAIDYLTVDKSIKKVGKTITIGGQKFTDDVSEEGEMLINAFTYVGDYKALNASLLEYMCSACEEYSYDLIDKHTGKQIASFTNIPVFSKNYEYVMDLGQLFSDNPTILYYYKWKDWDNPDAPRTYKEFANWSPVGKGFWGTDNCFYTPVVPTIVIDNHNADEAKRTADRYNFRYVKITIKGPSPKQE